MAETEAKFHAILTGEGENHKREHKDKLAASKEHEREVHEALKEREHQAKEKGAKVHVEHRTLPDN